MPEGSRSPSSEPQTQLTLNLAKFSMGARDKALTGPISVCVVPPVGLEPTLLSEPDFESGASTNSTTGARGRF